MPSNANRAADAVSCGGLIFTSGVAAIDERTMKPMAPDFRSQCRDVFERLDRVLSEFSSDRRSVIKVECYLENRELFVEWNEAFAAYFAENEQWPARTTTVATLMVEGLLVEVQLIARQRTDDSMATLG